MCYLRNRVAQCLFVMVVLVFGRAPDGREDKCYKTGIFAIEMISHSHWPHGCVCVRATKLLISLSCIFWCLCTIRRYFCFNCQNKFLVCVFFRVVVSVRRSFHRSSSDLSLKTLYFSSLCRMYSCFDYFVVDFCCQYQGQCDCTKISQPIYRRTHTTKTNESRSTKCCYLSDSLFFPSSFSSIA